LKEANFLRPYTLPLFNVGIIASSVEKQKANFSFHRDPISRFVELEVVVLVISSSISNGNISEFHK